MVVPQPSLLLLPPLLNLSPRLQIRLSLPNKSQPLVVGEAGAEGMDPFGEIAAVSAVVGPTIKIVIIKVSLNNNNKIQIKSLTRGGRSTQTFLPVQPGPVLSTGNVGRPLRTVQIH